MPSPAPKPLYAKDYVYTAKTLGLANSANPFKRGDTGASISQKINANDRFRALFSSQTEIDDYANAHEVIYASSPSDPNSNGADVLVLLNKENNSIQVSNSGDTILNSALLA